MSGDEDVGRFSPLSRQQVLTLLGGSQGSFRSSAVQSVSQTIVPGNALALPSTVEGVIPQPVTWLSAGWAGPVRTENWMAEPVAEGGNELRWAEEKTQTRRRNHG